MAQSNRGAGKKHNNTKVPFESNLFIRFETFFFIYIKRLKKKSEAQNFSMFMFLVVSC